MSKKRKTSDQSAEIYLVASGDLRLSANQKCWDAQKKMEDQIAKAFEKEGFTIKRAHPYDEKLKHGFISTQRQGMDVISKIPKDARVIVAEAVWQYSYHVVSGLYTHKGPILTIANWSGEWPGLVGLLNLNASLAKVGVKYSTIWSETFEDDFFTKSISQWLKEGKITHDLSHKKPLKIQSIDKADAALGKKLADDLLERKAIMGIFDEGCMGMVNACFTDEILNNCGIFKERLSQSALLYQMSLVTDKEAQDVYYWLKAKGMKFVYGPNEATDLTEGQVLKQCKMYIAAGRIANDYGCDLIGIQYQQGLKDMCPASDLAEGLLNNSERPPIYCRDDSTKELFPGKPITHFNEVDQGAGVDALITTRVCEALKLDPSTTLHDIRWGEHIKTDKLDDYVWVFEISGSVPPNHLTGGFSGASSERQPPMYFPLGGGSIKGVSKPGSVVWSRVYQVNGALQADIGRATSVELPQEDVERRWKATTEQWPVMNAVLSGVSRDQLMAGHLSNHIQVVYGDNEDKANQLLRVKAAMFHHLGIKVNLVGKI